MRLHIPPAREKGKRWYCGPFAFAAMTGYSFEDSREAINWARRRPANSGICSVQPEILRRALIDNGYRVGLREDLDWVNENFNQWLNRFQRSKGAVYLLMVTSHYVVVQDDWFIDNHTKHKVHISQAPWKRKRVLKVWKITDLNDEPDWR